MMVPEEFKDLLADETKAIAFLATTMGDGSPQVTPVWFDTEGEFIRVNSASGRVKDRNMKSRPNVAIAIMNLEDPYRYLQVRGVVVDITEEGARAHIDKLANKYRGTETYEWYGGETRVMYRIAAQSVQTMG